MKTSDQLYAQAKHFEKIHRVSVLSEVLSERQRQHEKWGEQNHPNGTGGAGTIDDRGYAQGHCKDALESGYGSWHDILREEFCEAVAETDPAKLRAELIQVAAVAVQWVECIDRKGWL